LPPMKCRINYGGETGTVTITQGEKFVILREDKGEFPATWSTRSGKVKLADGTIHDAVLDFCDSDSGEHYGTGIWTGTGLVWQDDEHFLKALGKTKRDVYPYIYHADTPVPGDIHHQEAF